MPANSQKDLFDDSTMSFGEHLEELRTRLWKGLIGLALGVLLALFVGDQLIALIRIPIDNALKKQNKAKYLEAEGETKIQDRSGLDYVKTLFGYGTDDSEEEPTDEETDGKVIDDSIRARVKAREFAQQLHKHYPKQYNAPPEKDDDKEITITLWAPEFAQFKRTRELAKQTQELQSQPITLTVQEAFLTYIKVSVVAGLVLSAPWLFYQIWMFVAAGLYPHEKKYVYVFLPVSTILFLTGAAFCFFVVFQFVLEFLLEFNDWLNTSPQIRLSEWISFAIMLPVMFGLSFQLPLVMLFLERITVFEVKTYRERRRMAILVISIASMLLTPSDPMSMMLMMIPLCVLYELGIFMCSMMESKQPFEPETV